MIIRSSRPLLPFDASRSLQPAFEQLNLPWLCPALCGLSARQPVRSAATIAERRPGTIRAPPLPKISQTATAYKSPPSRGFAYAAVADHADSNDDYIPFDRLGLPRSLSKSSGYPWGHDKVSSGLPTFSPAAPLVIHDSLRPAPRNFRENGDGIGGEIAEIHQTLEACLQVGRLERAAATVRRLTAIYKLEAPELIKSHNGYLASLIDRVVNTKNQELLKHVQRWFEVDIRARGIPPNDVTYGLMLRAAFQEANQLKIDRVIRRYVALAEQAGLRDEALSTALSILNSQQIGRVTQVCPTTFYDATDLRIEDSLLLDSVETVPGFPLEKALHHVRAQQQKGLGLVALQKSLFVFSQPAPHAQLANEPVSEEAKRLAIAYQRQEHLEKDTWTSALERWRSEHEESLKRMGVHNGLQTKPVGAVMWSWHEALVPLIREEINRANKAEFKKEKMKQDHERIVYGPFLQYTSPEKISAVTIIQCLNRMSTVGIERGTKVASLVSSIGQAIQDESIAEAMKSRNTRLNSKGVATELKRKELIQLIKRRIRFRAPVQSSSNSKSSSKYQESVLPTAEEDWQPSIKAQVGAILVSLLIQAAKIEVTHRDSESLQVSKEIQPVFWNSYQYENGKRYGVIRLNAAMSAKLTKEPVKGALSKHLPMLVEPMPWSQYKKGGFLHAGVPVVRGGTQHTQLREYIRAAADNGDMAQVFAGLDILGRTPWRINRAIFYVMLEVWNSGEALANIPAENPKFNYPQELGSSADAQQRRKHAYRIREIENARDGMHSERCFLNFQLEVARAYLEETFYFPHNVDFRGRAYPIPPYLNHMGADNCRGLLLFGKGKELGESGLVWLKIHLANVFGYDKASFKERQDFTTDRLTEIYDSASNPLNGSRWWLKAEDPWQCLATCVELRNALNSHDPTKYVSYLPVHQDGTCNGLQHYAALGGDAIGAKQVNLEPGDRPSDIYTAVADVVQCEVAKDAASGDPIAKLLEGKITRKVVKPTVMTNVYGVTFQGAKRQVATQLRDLYPTELTADARQLIFLSSYVTRKIFAALSAMFNGAHDIQYWLGECASRICEALTSEQVEWIEANATGKMRGPSFASKPTNEIKLKSEHTRFKSSVIWTTPLKMPVVQPYRSSSSKVIKTNLQMISLNEPSASDPVSKRKQLQGFPPNFIHSLDATHMLLSALKCNELGLSFAAVHDSFWTHAADLDAMNGVIRDSFISMHSEDIVGRLAAEFAARYKGSMYLAHVKANSTLGRRITTLRGSKSKKLEAQGQIEELIKERQRLRLLASKDPDEQAKGRAMETPAKLFLERGKQEELVTLEESHGLDGVIGEVTKRDTKDSESEPNTTFESDRDVFDTLQPVFASTRPFAQRSLLPKAVDSVDPLEPQNDNRTAVNRRARMTRSVWLWLPLSFPPVPKKGSFEVSRLKDSKYFFS